jgi:hypothetical protein
MLRIPEFDIKTGKSLQKLDPATGESVARTKDIECSYLEEWLQQCFLSGEMGQSQLSVAKYYDGIQVSDIETLVTKGRELVFTSGSLGYFTSPEIADLLRQQPIFESGEASVHNAVAYGSLIVSDGYTQTKTKGGTTRILIVDNRSRSIGDVPLAEYDPTRETPKQLSRQEVDRLLDIMGDGTMLIGTPTMRDLLLKSEIATSISKVFRQKEIELDPAQSQSLLNDYLEQGYIDQSRLANYGIKSDDIDRAVDSLANRTVVQFRSAISGVSGLMKGTCQTSSWCARLGVDAIVSLDNIKGHRKGDGALYTPGIQEVDGDLWINRKKVAKYSQQSVGPQVKGKVPEATLSELNPRSIEIARSAASLASDPYSLAQSQVAKVEKNLGRPLLEISELEDPEANDLSTAEAFATVLKADRYGQVTLMPVVDEQLTRKLSRQWKDAATHGVTVPSAMAQHHSALKPWEICNRDLPEGSIVVYYRSPFGNVGAAAVGINNLGAISTDYPESFQKRGVSYLPPWTAEQIAITDFDSDYNGYFVAGVVQEPAVILQEMRDRLATVGDNPQEQYEAGLAYIDAMVHKEGSLVSDPEHFPLAVREFLVQNRPENKSLPIPKAKKILHPMLSGEARSSSIARAWAKTAENPVGIVANLSMVLESLSQNITYTEPGQRKAILGKVVQAFQKIDPSVILSDEELVIEGLPALNFHERIKTSLADSATFPEQALVGFASILQDAAAYPLAKNLQLAVDIQKSAQGIIDRFQEFSKKLSYQQHALRKDIKSPEAYRTAPLKNNTVDPVGVNVEVVNGLYSAVPSRKIDREVMNTGFRQIIPRIHSAEELQEVNELVERYRKLSGRLRSSIERLREKNREDLQPSFVLTSNKTGKTLAVERICDAQRTNEYNLALLDGKGNFKIGANLLPGAQNKNFPVVCMDENGNTLGYISTDSLQRAGVLKDFLQRLNTNDSFTLNATAEVFPPYTLQNDKDAIYAEMTDVLSHIKERFDGREDILVSALWTSSTGMGVAFKVAPQEIIGHLDRVPDIQIYGGSEVCQSLQDHQGLDIRFDLVTIGGAVTPIASLLTPDGGIQPLGALSRLTSNLAPGTVVKADILPVALDPKLRLKIKGQAIAVTPAPDFERLIPAAIGQFIFKASEEGVNAYLAEGDNLALLGKVDDTSLAKIQLNALSTGQYSRGELVSKSGKQFLIQVRSLVEHQPVSKDLLALEMPNKILSFPHQQEESTNILSFEQRDMATLQVAEPAAKYSVDCHQPTRGQLKDYYRAAVLLGLPAETQAKIISIGKAQVENVPIEQQTDDYRNPATSFSVAEYQEMNQVIDRALIPTRCQLISWYERAEKAENSEEMLLIKNLGESQIEGTNEAQKPPQERDPAFTNPAVRLNWAQATLMHQVNQLPQRLRYPELQR